MGCTGKLEEKSMALKLRRQGLSYSEIREKVPVSKDTLSRWCRDVILNIGQMERLQRRRLKGAEKGRLISAKKQQKKRIEGTKRLLEEGKKEVGKMTKRDRFIAGIALYLGDGQKGDKNVGFSNSNPQIISFMMKWVREFCLIPEVKLRGQIWIHDNLNERKAREYWSSLTDIPLSQFHKSYISKNKINSLKVRKNLHEYGVFAIRTSNAAVQRKIHGWFVGVLGRKLL